MARKDRPARPLETTRSTQTAEFTPTQEQVRSRAYELYRARCESGVRGDAVTDWLAAEGELKSRTGDRYQSAWE